MRGEDSVPRDGNAPCRALRESTRSLRVEVRYSILIILQIEVRYSILFILQIKVRYSILFILQIKVRYLVLFIAN